MAVVPEAVTPDTVTPDTRVHTTACPLDCPDTCSLSVTVEAGMIVGVDAGPGNPLTDGFICQKVKHHARRVYAPERVLTPLVRTGPKGAGEFRAASWDEALDLVAERLRDAEARFGAESVVPYVYNSSAPAMQSLVINRFFRRFGASFVDDTICAATHGRASCGARTPRSPMFTSRRSSTRRVGPARA
jgi:anaerobic selenocysteine-containing dehydrogenase